jgi:hypothetical protein
VSGLTGRPDHGLRIEVALDEAASSAERAVYRGHLHLPDRSVAIEAVATTTALSMTWAEPVDPAHEKTAAALLRAATRSELAAGLPVPRTIARWRAG